MLASNAELKFHFIDKKEDLLPYKSFILDCFLRSYQKPLDGDTWDWAYIHNICGDPLVSLAFNDTRCVGHYAVIPIFLRKGDQQLKACLSMTTMVDPDYQRKGLFTKLAYPVYQAMPCLDVKLVVGFPNQNSAHGLNKYCAWTLTQPSEFMVSVSKDQMIKSKSLKAYLHRSNVIHLDTKDQAFLAWRLSKPGQYYEKYGGSIIKKYNDDYDILYLDKDFEHTLPHHYQYNILIDHHMDDLEHQKIHEYQFGYRLFSDELISSYFKKDMLMSDVF